MQYLGTDANYQDIANIAQHILERRNIQKEIFAHPNIALLDAVEATWTQETETFAWDTTNYRLGSKSGKLTTTSGSYNAVASRSLSFNGSGKMFSIWLKKSSTITGISIFVLAPDWSNYANFGVGVANYPNDTWFNLIFPMDTMTITGNPNLGSIATLRIEAIGSVNTATLHFDDIRLAHSALPKGAIMIAFDDGNDSDFIYAKAKMDEYGYRGVSYIIGNQVGQSNYLTIAQMKQMQDIGWDIASHSWSHPDYTTLTEAQMLQETISMKHYLSKNGFASGARFFAYPYGAVNTLTLDTVAKYHLISRGVGSFGVTLGVSNVPLFSPSYLQCAVVINTTTTSVLNTWINNVKSTKSLGCILFHRLVAASPTEWQYLVSNFNTFIDAIAASGVPVVTMSDLADKLLPAHVVTQDPIAWLNLM